MNAKGQTSKIEAIDLAGCFAGLAILVERLSKVTAVMYGSASGADIISGTSGGIR